MRYKFAGEGLVKDGPGNKLLCFLIALFNLACLFKQGIRMEDYFVLFFNGCSPRPGDKGSDSRWYKDLALVEQTFRRSKTVQLEMKPYTCGRRAEHGDTPLL
ncbi:MAG TPA: hypothetical protein ACFYDZ_09555 [Candidatus Brocadiaceae bacterium]